MARTAGVVRTRSGGWSAWVAYLVGGVELTARWTTAKILAITELLDRTAQTVRDDLPKTYSLELVRLLVNPAGPTRFRRLVPLRDPSLPRVSHFISLHRFASSRCETSSRG